MKKNKDIHKIYKRVTDFQAHLFKDTQEAYAFLKNDLHLKNSILDYAHEVLEQTAQESISEYQQYEQIEKAYQEAGRCYQEAKRTLSNFYGEKRSFLERLKFRLTHKSYDQAIYDLPEYREEKRLSQMLASVNDVLEYKKRRLPEYQTLVWIREMLFKRVV